MKLWIGQIGKFIIYKSKNTYDEPCYLVDSETGTMYFDCRWYNLKTLYSLLRKLT